MTKTSNIAIIYINAKQNSLKYPTRQTRTIRDKTNEKINQLGQKYFDVKNKFDILNIHRDILFDLGKELVEAYKDIKIGISIQSQMKRMKDALYCWFTENFYNEIFDPKSLLMKRLIYLENQNFLHVKCQQVHTQIDKDLCPKKYKRIAVNIAKNEKNEDIKKSILNEMKTNGETDNFEFLNAEKDNLCINQENSSQNVNNNFDFNKILDF